MTREGPAAAIAPTPKESHTDVRANASSRCRAGETSDTVV